MALSRTWLLIVSAILATGCLSAPQVTTARLPPATPAMPVRSLMLLQPRLDLEGLEVKCEPLPALSLESFRPEPEARPLRIRRVLERAAGNLRKFNERSMTEVVDQYERQLDRWENRYQAVEEFAADWGVDRSEFRSSLGLAMATTATTLGALHALQPTALTPQLLGTEMRAGYDVTRLDDPRVMFAYSDRLSVTVSKRGVGGSVALSPSFTGIADISLRSQVASAQLAYQDHLTLGMEYAPTRSAVKGFVRLAY